MSIGAQFLRIENVILADPGQRGVRTLRRRGDLEHAAEMLQNSSEVLIGTGFFIPAAGACETDGPLGALALGQALEKIDVAAGYWTDTFCEPVLRKAGLEPLRLHDPDWRPEGRRPTLVSIERCGRAADGHYYNMRGMDITTWTAPMDQVYLARRPKNVGTIGIGDGGNEIGMGRVRDEVIAAIPNGRTIGCVVPTDHLIVAGVSNWGAWGLIAALSLLERKNLLPSAEAAKEELDRLVAAGAVDGISGRAETTIDGLAWDVHRRVLDDLHAIVRTWTGK